MRSWIQVPADKEKALGQVASSGADVVVVDLARAGNADAKQHSRLAARDWLVSHREQLVAARRFERWARVGPVSSPQWRDDLDAALEGAPDGIVLAGCSGSEDIQQFAAMLYEGEAKAGLRSNSIRIVPELGGTPLAALNLAAFANELHARIVGYGWDAASLARSIGARRMRGPGGLWIDPLAHVRAQVLLAAHARGLQAIEAGFRDHRDAEGAERAIKAARADGFTGMVAVHPSQVDAINRNFAPSADETAEARELIGLFSLNPGAEVMPFRGRYVGQAELARAKALLGEA
ncbi:HpcH/HpaI aldolase/citrate lyase family protein [Qipengyuania aquimaris]|uniref:HpcH/HpaI aldolase/citrate lyase family protein n=1 Tax=Qipengyuania aquimaris TaxID=255984 RepID=UPI001CD40BEC|nr:aldolase/citrate lyase family protein [Qipengyuania aquimaris]MCA0903956.1 CoA ester lyase [Qipengyuania aquimaris]